MASATNETNGERVTAPGAQVTLTVRPERRLLRPGGSRRHLDVCVQVTHAANRPSAERPPLALALVLDRSGSMAGEKIAMAKRAALAVLDRLDERDRLALVVFDDRIDVLAPAAAATRALKARLRQALADVDARGSTALHEGWLIGAREIACEDASAAAGELSRLFLLTDGLANVGLTDVEQITSQAADIRERTGISTSTFGIGGDYNEALLGPMAVAGGGQFHHLRSTTEIASTFVGELRELLDVAAARVRLEIKAGADLVAEVVSEYHARHAAGRWLVDVGDLLSGEERHVVVRFAFPAQHGHSDHLVRARVVWKANGVEQKTPWQEVVFTYAGHDACDAEPRDTTALHWVGLHHAERAQREAAQLSKRGDLDGALRRLRQVARRILEYAGDDSDLHAAVQELREAERDVAERPVDAMVAKETWFRSLRRSRGQRDLRQLL